MKAGPAAARDRSDPSYARTLTISPARRTAFDALVAGSTT